MRADVPDTDIDRTVVEGADVVQTIVRDPAPPNNVIGSVGVKSGLMLLIPKFSVPLLKNPTLP
ncbi:hypothetical protein I551_7497 [Mycobacterium ulcerans str. Harvey]|uniref:Uncharacterized protein n=1 Tax=Mycobacterium ulcerans str. Harvey TaxID=1299332 RepID=A0ABP3A5W8_MYCUL|nr:hypothetical protein I551_7497 [Mycobacterium ulcerans str. Harvey]